MFLHIFAELLYHVEANTYTVIVFAQVADGLQVLVTTHGRHRLKHTQKLLRLEQDGDAVQLFLRIAVRAHQKGFQGDLLRGLVESLAAAKWGTCYLCRETAVLLKGDGGVAGRDAYLLIVGE